MRSAWFVAGALGFSLGVGGCKEPVQQTDLPMTPLRVGDGGFMRPYLPGDGGLANVVVDPMDPESLYLSGQELFIAGEFEKAADQLKKALRLKPSARAWHALGDALLSQGRFAEAEDAFEEAVALEPNKRLSWTRLGRCQLNQGKPSQAVESMAKAVALKPDDAEGLRQHAEALIESKRDPEAIEQLKKALALDGKGAAKDWKTIGQLHVLHEQWAEAAAALRESAKAHPDPGIWSELGEALVHTGDLAAARAAFEEVVKLDPKDPLAHETIGELLLKQGEVESARKAFEASLKAKDRTAPHLALGRIAAKDGKKDAARSELDLALAASKGEDVTEIREVAHFAMELGAADAAEKLLTMLAGDESVKKEPDLYLELARARQALKDVKGMKAACEQMKALLPKDDKTPCPPK